MGNLAGQHAGNADTKRHLHVNEYNAYRDAGNVENGLHLQAKENNATCQGSKLRHFVAKDCSGKTKGLLIQQKKVTAFVSLAASFLRT